MRLPRQFDFVQWVNKRVLASLEPPHLTCAFVVASSLRIAEQDTHDALARHAALVNGWTYDHAHKIWRCAMPPFQLHLTTYERLDEAMRGRIPFDLRHHDHVWHLT